MTGSFQRAGGQFFKNSDYQGGDWDFCLSKTGKALYDESTKLWCNGPSYIADIYREELETDRKKRK